MSHFFESEKSGKNPGSSEHLLRCTTPDADKRSSVLIGRNSEFEVTLKS